MIRFACPGCSTVYSAADEHAGKRTTCKKCGMKFHIPSASDVEPAPVPPAQPYDIEASAPPAPPVPEREHSFLAAPPAPEPPPLPPAVPVELNPCPKCGAKMSVHPEDVGFDIQCPFCQTVFRGEASTESPALDSTAPPAPAPAPEPEPEGVEIAPCPKCRAELTVAPADVGGEVECPFCQTVYLAEKPKPKANTLLARPSKKPPAPPPPKGKKQSEDPDDKTPLKMKVQVDDDDDDYEPRKKKKKKRRRPTYRDDPYDERLLMREPSDGVTCLLLGLATFFCCIFIAFAAIPRCRDTIDKVNSGVMDSSAKPLAMTGLIMSYIAIGLFILNIVGNCVLMGLGGGGGRGGP